jgi:translation initiation factor 1 (eIF-1/SUI1)
MVDVNNIGVNLKDQFADIDSKIVIRLIKEPRSVTSYISGLEKFMNEEKIKELIKTLKTQLGTRSVTKEVTENRKTHKIYGFGGDKRSEIKEYLMKSGIEDEKIDVKM